MERYYLALGDSITSGYNVGSQNFTVLYYSYLRSCNPYLRFFNLGINGLTTNGLVSLFLTNPQLRQMVTRADIITITIGSNDLLKGTAALVRGLNIDYGYILSNIKNNLDYIGLQIRQLNPVTIVKIASIYHPVLPYQLAHYYPQVQYIIRQANKVIVSSTKRYGFDIIPVDRAFNGRERLLMGPDHIHPNPLGHRIIADACIG